MEESIKVKENDAKKRSFFKEWVMPVISAIIICLLLNKFVFFNVQVPTGSMIPTINLENRLTFNIDNHS